jgi:hypothetical protein
LEGKGNKMKKIYLVLGVENTGSSSLTFPESFDFNRAYLDKYFAQKKCDELNKGLGIYVEDGYPYRLNDDDNESDPYTGTYYEVHPVDLDDTDTFTF